MTGLISAATMAQLTKLNESAMVETFIVTVVTPISDGAGSDTDQETTFTTKGQFWTVRGDEAGTDQVKVRGEYRIDVPQTVSIPPTARITRVSTGKTYAVKFPAPPDSFAVGQIIGLKDV